MTISIGYILGHLCEFLLFIYFANTSFYPRKSYIISSLISLFGYIALFGIGLIGSAPISIMAFFIVNVLLLIYCYNIGFCNAVFYSLMLDMFSCVGEYVCMYILNMKYTNIWEKLIFTQYQAIITVMGGKLIYFAGILFLKFFMDKKMIYESKTPLILAFVPILTIACMTALMSLDMNNLIFLLFFVALSAMNFIAFYVNFNLSRKNFEIRSLQEELSEYQLLAEKYEGTKIMRHDFHKQLDVLKNLITEDNVQAKEYMRQIQFSQRELDYTQYTDNKILNILFAQKVKECHKRGIEIHIHSKAPSMSFISDIDTVAIFSNMLDNAMEATAQSEKKEIYVELYTVNNTYSVVKIENYADKEPVILDGELRTQKKNSDVHGIGIKSINNALKKYKSELTWSYDKERKFFKSAVSIHIPNQKNSVQT